MKKQNEEPSEFDDDWTKNLDQLRLKFGFLFESSITDTDLRTNKNLQLGSKVLGCCAARDIAELKEQLYKLRRELKSDQESVALELNHQIELQTRVTGNKKMVKANATVEYFDDAQLEIFDRVQIGGGAEDSKKTTEKDELKLIRSTIAGVTGDFSAVGRQTRPELGYKV
ncbi:unnamed protein product [Ilex paraguariensis]|uniref:Uncharacterized protein n=1 Tax=Ilex paraguariensis TaxID=185542 RepID=A0ABC8T066_9AQUA